MPRLLLGRATLFARFEDEGLIDPRITLALRSARREGRRGAIFPTQVVDSATLLHEMRRTKAAEEIELMARAIAITGEAHTLAMAHAKPGVHEYEVEALLREKYPAPDELLDGPDVAPLNVTLGARAASLALSDGRIVYFCTDGSTVIDGGKR